MTATNTNTNTIKWIRHEVSKHRLAGETLYSACGPFEWAGNGAFEIAIGTTIGKPFRLAFIDNGTGVRQFCGAFKTVSGAKQAAKKFGTWRN
jgi:hypothetical protein